MPLQSRVDPFGELFADASRGLLMGNRGGRFHDDEQALGSRRWASRQWICCRLSFNGRQRAVWGRSYTELFFLDEVTAFAAGHRPCFECRRKDAEAFAALFPSAGDKRARADDVDRVLHAERLDGRAKRKQLLRFGDLPDGAFIDLDGNAYAIRGGRPLRWTSAGYVACTMSVEASRIVPVLTPPSILSVLTAGYQPLWHPSAVAGG